MPDSPDRDKELRQALRLAGFGIWRWDLHTHHVEWDEQMHALYGLAPGEFGGHPDEVVAYTHPDDREEFRRLLRTRTKTPTHERRIVLPDGSVRWVTTTTSFLEGSHERGVLTGISWDTTERHQMLESLHANASHLQQAHRIARLATWTWDVNEEVRWSREMFELYDAPQSITPTREEHDALVHPEDRRQMRRGFIEALKSGLPEAQLEYRVVHSDGSVHHLLSRFRMEHDAQGRVSRIMGVMQDVTDQMRAAQERLDLEAQLQQAQRLESLGTLASGIAHDFNNLLLAIGGNAQLALADCPPDSPLYPSLVEIEKARRRASELVRRILTFGRPTALDRKPTDLGPVVHEALKLLRAAVPAMVELRAHVQPSLPAVLADASQMHQVVMNLVTNAAQAIGERGGVVDVILEEADLHEPPPGVPALPAGSYVRLSVIDDGPGMDATTRSRMFEPFFTTKSAGRGTGLGLAVVHGIVKGHRGGIAVTSAPGEGARLDVYLPVTNAAPRAQPETASAVRRGAGQRVLFIDDEESIVYLISRTLERWGYQVTAFTDPVLAIAAFRDRPEAFDIVITDLTMPGMTGFEVARSIHELRADAPVVLISGNMLDDDLRQARRVGIVAFTPKPSAAEELPRVIDTILRGKRAPAGAEPAGERQRNGP